MRVLAISIVLLALMTTSVRARVWTAANGRGQVDAEYLGFEEGKVKLQHRTTGKVLFVPVGVFVDADQEFVRRQAARQPSPIGRGQDVTNTTTLAPENEPSTALQYVTRGHARIKQADCVSAIRDFTRAIKLDPRNATAYNGRGLAHQKRGELAVAQQDFDKAIELDPDYAAAYRNRAENLSKLAADEGESSPELDDTIEQWQQDWHRSHERNMSHSPWQPLPSRRRAVSREATLQQMARADMERAEQLEEPESGGQEEDVDSGQQPPSESHDHQPARRCSVCPYCGRSDDDGSLPLQSDHRPQDYREGYIASLEELAETYVEEGHHDRAVEVYSRLLDEAPETTRYLRQRAYAHTQQGAYEDARRDYERLLDIEAEPDATLYYNRGCSQLAARRLREAVEDFTASIALRPSWSIAHNNRGSAYARQGQYDRAVEDFTKAIECDPGDHLAYRNRALAYKRLGESDKAQADFDTFQDLKGSKGPKPIEVTISSAYPR